MDSTLRFFPVYISMPWQAKQYLVFIVKGPGTAVIRRKAPGCTGGGEQVVGEEGKDAHIHKGFSTDTVAQL